MHLLFSTNASSSPWGDAGLAVLRVVAGLAMAFSHGFGKLPPKEQFIEGVGKMGFPMPEFFAWAAGFSEGIGGILLAIGLLTRPSAFLILCTMLVAGMIRHGADPFKEKELAFIYAAIAIGYMLYGAGRYSVDYFISRRTVRTEPEA